MLRRRRDLLPLFSATDVNPHPLHVAAITTAVA